ncbi:MAG: type II toxin-antitoxin system PemK/MazF family toxin [Ardenticatenaceae bacterium]
MMNRGEVWLITLEPTVGAEMKKTRPAIIMSDDTIGVLPLRVIVPITVWKDRYAISPWMVQLTPRPTNGLTKLSAADAFQVRCVAQERFIRQLGSLSTSDIEAITLALAKVFRIPVSTP